MSTVVPFAAVSGWCSNEECGGKLVVDAAGMDRVLGIGMLPEHVNPYEYRIEHVYCERCGTLYHPSRAGFPVGES